MNSISYALDWDKCQWSLRSRHDVKKLDHGRCCNELKEVKHFSASKQVQIK